jgi:hypothetical protein
MIKLKLKTLLLTIITVLGVTGLGFLFWKYHTEAIYTMVGVIVLMFIRHIYVAIDHLVNE